jgi:hypothetical protein
MKTTNLETSKKLKELGFEADFEYCYEKEGQLWNKTFELDCWDEYDEREHIPAYDLETILEALPKEIKCKDKNYHFWTTYSASSDCWIMGYVWGIERNMNFETYNEGDESLANTAGRLLIKLLEDNIIKLGE